MTGAMPTTPTVAVEVLLRPPPLHVITKVEALVGMHRLNCSEPHKPRVLHFINYSL
jgi:hypothetical protein